MSNFNKSRKFMNKKFNMKLIGWSKKNRSLYLPTPKAQKNKKNYLRLNKWRNSSNKTKVLQPTKSLAICMPAKWNSDSNWFFDLMRFRYLSFYIIYKTVWTTQNWTFNTKEEKMSRSRNLEMLYYRNRMNSFSWKPRVRPVEEILVQS